MNILKGQGDHQGDHHDPLRQHNEPLINKPDSPVRESKRIKGIMVSDSYREKTPTINQPKEVHADKV